MPRWAPGAPAWVNPGAGGGSPQGRGVRPHHPHPPSPPEGGRGGARGHASRPGFASAVPEGGESTAGKGGGRAGPLPAGPGVGSGGSSGYGHRKFAFSCGGAGDALLPAGRRSSAGALLLREKQKFKGLFFK